MKQAKKAKQFRVRLHKRFSRKNIGQYSTTRRCFRQAYTKDGETVTEMPYDTEGWQPVYEELPGWHTPLTELRAEADFPQAFKDYIAYIEKATATPITIVSVGPDREATIIR